MEYELYLNKAGIYIVLKSLPDNLMPPELEATFIHSFICLFNTYLLGFYYSIIYLLNKYVLTTYPVLGTVLYTEDPTKHIKRVAYILVDGP